MAKNIVYLLGAGASINAIPAYDNFKNSFIDFITDIITYINAEMMVNNNYKDYHLKDLITNLEALLKKLYAAETPDVVAKQLIEAGNYNLLYEHLKKLMSLFIICNQMPLDESIMSKFRFHNNLPKKFSDSRYDEFILSEIQQGIPKIKPHIKIISWNYDLQMETSYYRAKEQHFDSIIENLNIIPYNKKIKLDTNLNESAIIKLNGTAGVYESPHEIFFKYNLKSGIITISYFKEMIEHLSKNNLRLMPNESKLLFSFAWENNEFTRLARKKAMEVISNANVLICIGYSFPRFNIEVDKEILSLFNGEKIILNVAKNDYLNVRKRLLKILPKKQNSIDYEFTIIEDEDLKQFPYES
jgi:hypothetical protein